MNDGYVSEDEDVIGVGAEVARREGGKVEGKVYVT